MSVFETAAVTDEELRERFTPVFEQIAAGTLDREADRRLPYAEVDLLRQSGFTSIRVPVEHGGLGASLTQLIGQLVDLGRADSNLPQLLRSHLGFVETRLAQPDDAARTLWLERVAAGAVIGAAASEQASNSFWQNATTLHRSEDGQPWLLSGRKFYSTGSLFADWILTSATVDEQNSAMVLVSATAPGVERIDDWDGFGQRLTGSGTTIFTDVEIDPADVQAFPNGVIGESTAAAFAQLMHLAALSGIGQAAVDDAVRYVRGRKRNLMNPAHPAPQHDPQVQEVVGRIAGAAYAAKSTTLAAAAQVERAHDAQRASAGTTELFDAAEIAVYLAQGQVVNLVLGLTTELFEVGGATAVTERLALDRHWRNARTISSHNPVNYRNSSVGEHLLLGTAPGEWIARTWRDAQTSSTTGTS